MVTGWVKMTEERKVFNLAINAPDGLPHAVELAAILGQLRLASGIKNATVEVSTSAAALNDSLTPIFQSLEAVGEEGWTKETIGGHVTSDVLSRTSYVPFAKSVMDACQNDIGQYGRTMHWLHRISLAHVNALRFKLSEFPSNFPFRVARLAVFFRGADVLMGQHFPDSPLTDELQHLVDESIVVMGVIALTSYLEVVVQPVIAERSNGGHKAIWDLVSKVVGEIVDSIDGAVLTGRSDVSPDFWELAHY